MVIIRIAIHKQHRTYFHTIRGESISKTQRADSYLQVHVSNFTHDDATSSYGMAGLPSSCKADPEWASHDPQAY